MLLLLALVLVLVLVLVCWRTAAVLCWSAQATGCNRSHGCCQVAIEVACHVHAVMPGWHLAGAERLTSGALDFRARRKWVLAATLRRVPLHLVGAWQCDRDLSIILQLLTSWAASKQARKCTMACD